MRTNLYRALIASFVALTMLFVPLGIAAQGVQQGLAIDLVSPQASTTTKAAVVKSKHESVYGVLSAEGIVEGIYVVNRFELQSSGTITDYGSYSAVENLTDTGIIKNSDGVVTAQAQGLSFDYKGTLEQKELPWNIGITYELDGAKIAPSDLAGKSGKVKIHIATSKNDTFEDAFYDNYALQISLKIDTSISSDIQAAGATVADAGSYKSISYIALPGNDVDATISAQVKDFAMAGVSINAVPLSMSLDVPETGSIIGQFQTLTDALSMLDQGAGALEDGSGSLKTGAEGLVGGSTEIAGGLDSLSSNSSFIVSGSQQFKDALDAIVGQLDGESGGIDLSGLMQLPGALREIAGGLDAMVSQLETFKGSFATAYTTLDASMQQIPGSGSITQERIDTLRLAAGPGAAEQSTIDDLVSGYEAGQNAKSTYDYVKPAFDAVAFTVEGVQDGLATSSAALNTIAQNVESSLVSFAGLGQLVEGLNELAAQYALFHEGLVSFAGGVQTLATQYASFHAGIERFSGGVAALYQGVRELHSGTTLLNDNMVGLPDMIQEEIDSLVGQYDKSDFVPISFTSPKNTNIGSVQFVLVSEGIEKAEEPKQAITQEAPDQGFWGRLLALFQ